MVNLPFLSRLDRSYAFRQILTFVLAFVDATREKFVTTRRWKFFKFSTWKWKRSTLSARATGKSGHDY